MIAYCLLDISEFVSVQPFTVTNHGLLKRMTVLIFAVLFELSLGSRALEIRMFHQIFLADIIRTWKHSSISQTTFYIFENIN